MSNYPKVGPKVSLEQWRVFQAIIDHGGYAQAASYLHRSQSAVSYAMNRLQQQLGISLLKIEGRKALLTDSGEVLLQRSRQLLREATEIENFASHLQQDREAEIKFVVDAAFPNHILMSALADFAKNSQGTRVQLHEVVLSGASEALLQNEAELVIGIAAATTYLSDPLIDIDFVAVAHPAHPLHQLKRKISTNDLSHHMHVVIRDSGEHTNLDVGWLSSQQRWTVSSIDSALSAIEHGLGYGWLPQHRLGDALDKGQLKPLQLEQGSIYKAQLYMSYGHPQNIGTATRELAEIIKSSVENIKDKT